MFQNVMGQILDPKKQSEGGEDSGAFGIAEEKINELKQQFTAAFLLAEVAQNLGKLFAPEGGQDGDKLNVVGDLLKMVQNIGGLPQDESDSDEVPSIMDETYQ